MARSFNQVILMGNLTRDPELRTTPSGQSVCSFSLALNRQWKNQQGETQEAVDYIDCTAWSGLGERVAQYLSKGRPALVVGRLQQRSWEQDGQKRSKVEVLATEVTFLGGPGGNDGQPGGYSNTETSSASASKPAKKAETDQDDLDDEPINLDDIPF
jgi:single-strand DNA-binding protein